MTHQEERRADVAPLLRTVGLEGFERHYPRSSRAACASAWRWPARSR